VGVRSLDSIAGLRRPAMEKQNNADGRLHATPHVGQLWMACNVCLGFEVEDTGQARTPRASSATEMGRDGFSVLGSTESRNDARHRDLVLSMTGWRTGGRLVRMQGSDLRIDAAFPKPMGPLPGRTPPAAFDHRSYCGKPRFGLCEKENCREADCCDGTQTVASGRPSLVLRALASCFLNPDDD